MKKIFIYSISSILFLSSCLSETDNIMNEEDEQLNLYVYVNNNQGRAVYTESTLPAGSKIGLCVVDQSGNSYNNKDYNNVLYTATGSGNSQKWLSSPPVYLTTTKADVYGYYPYKSGVSIDNLQIETDSQTDYMWATPVNEKNMDNTDVSLSMNHALSLIRVSIFKEDMDEKLSLSALSLSSDGIASGAVLNGKNGNLSGFSGRGANFAATYEDIEIPDNANNAITTDFMVIPTGVDEYINFSCTVNGKEFRMKSKPQEPLKSGYIHCFDAVVRDTEIALNHISVIDWSTSTTNFSTSLPSSVVKAVKSDGTCIDYLTGDESCIAVALDLGDVKFWIEKNETSNTTWNTAYTTAGASNTDYTYFQWGPYGSDLIGIQNYTSSWPKSYFNYNWYSWSSPAAISDFNGLGNTAQLLSTTATDSYNTYPDAAVLVEEFNKNDNAENMGRTDWYIPACGQLKLVYLQKTRINAALTKIGGTPLADDYYWSSSENSTNYGWCTDFSQNKDASSYKYNGRRIRLIRDF